jgi:hypothetical protein
LTADVQARVTIKSRGQNFISNQMVLTEEIRGANHAWRWQENVVALPKNAKSDC